MPELSLIKTSLNQLQQPAKKLFSIPLKLALACVITGIMLKVMHWPFAGWLIITGFGTVALLYPIRFWKKENKRWIDFARLGFAVSWAINGIFTLNHFPYSWPIQFIAGILSLIWLLSEGVNFLLKEENTKPSVNSKWALETTLIIFACIVTVLGALFKIQHWPYADAILIAGLVLGVCWMLKDLFIKNELDNNDLDNE